MKNNFFLITIFLALVMALGYLLVTWKEHKTKAHNFNNGSEAMAVIDPLFNKLSNLDASDIDFTSSVVSINQDIQLAIESIENPKLLNEINSIYSKKSHNFTFALSTDKKVGTFSWNRRINNPAGDIKTIALYTKGEKLVPSSLYGNPVLCDQILKLNTKNNRAIYVFQGFDGQRKVNRIDAYTITANGPEEARIFPNGSNSIVSNGEGTKLPKTLSVTNDGSNITFSGSSNAENHDKNLIFNGFEYVYAGNDF